MHIVIRMLWNRARLKRFLKRRDDPIKYRLAALILDFENLYLRVAELEASSPIEDTKSNLVAAIIDLFSLLDTPNYEIIGKFPGMSHGWVRWISGIHDLGIIDNEECTQVVWDIQHLRLQCAA